MIKLRAIDAEPLGDDVIATLEEALAKAKAGDLSSVGLVVVYRDGTTGRAWSKAPSVTLLAGAAARLQYALLKLTEDE